MHSSFVSLTRSIITLQPRGLFFSLRNLHVDCKLYPERPVRSNIVHPTRFLTLKKSGWDKIHLLDKHTKKVHKPCTIVSAG